jgi:hypothetical protein
VNLNAAMRVLVLVAAVFGCAPDPRQFSFGAVLWQISPGRPSFEMTTDRDGDVIYVEASDGSGLVSKWSGVDGSLVWSTQLVPVMMGGVWAPHVASDDSGAIVLTGGFQGSVDFGGMELSSPNPSTFVARYTADGGLLWARSTGPASSLEVLAIATEPGGGSYVAGFCMGPIVLDGITVPCLGSFAAAFTRAGAARWVRAYSGSWGDTVVSVTSDDHVVVTNTILDPAYAARFTRDGEPEWAGVFDKDAAMTAVADREGNIVATVFDAPAAIDVIDPTGTAARLTTSASGQQELCSVVISNHGAIIVGGDALEAYSPAGDLLATRPHVASSTARIRRLATTASGSLAVLLLNDSADVSIAMLALHGRF